MRDFGQGPRRISLQSFLGISGAANFMLEALPFHI